MHHPVEGHEKQLPITSHDNNSSVWVTDHLLPQYVVFVVCLKYFTFVDEVARDILDTSIVIAAQYVAVC